MTASIVATDRRAGAPAGPCAPPPWDPWRAASVALGVMAASHADARALARLQDERLHALLESAARGSAYWRERLRGRDPGHVELAALPTSDKHELMSRFSDWVTDPEIRIDELRAFVRDPALIASAYLGRYAVWESSGSTGEPAIFVQDAGALAVYDALEALRRPGRYSPAQAWSSPWRTQVVAFVGATEGHFASTVSIERLRALNPLMAAAVRGVSFLLPPDAMAARLEALAPDVLATYPSMAVILAEAKLAGRLDIAPAEVWTGGETLGPAARARIEQAFGARVYDSYGCSECLSLASECARGRLHFNADWAILEAVDARGRPAEPGVPGARTLLTNLANHVQPILRYDLGDEIAFDPTPCGCGTNLPSLRVRGRLDESLELVVAGGRRVGVSPLAVCTVLEDEAGLFHFQIAQTGERRLELRTGGAHVASPGEEPAGTARLHDAALALKEFLATQGARGVEVRVRPEVPPERGRSGKIARVLGPPSAHRGPARR